MKLPKIEKFSLRTIADKVAKSDSLQAARLELARFCGAVLEVSGKVQKRVKRDAQCKLVIEPGDVPGFVVFADCLPDAEKVEARKIRKGSAVSVRGRLRSFGSSAVCLVGCRLVEAIPKL